MNIANEIDELESKGYEQNNIRRTWELNETVARLVRAWSVAETGSTDNIGVIITRSIENREQASEWIPRKFDSQGVPVGFNAPESLISSFTHGLDQYEYGQTLSNAIMSQYVRENGQIQSTDGILLSEVKMNHEVAISQPEVESFAKNTESIDYANRRGLISSIILDQGIAVREHLSTTIEKMFDVSRRSVRKDIKKVVNYHSNSSSCIEVAPTERLKNELQLYGNSLSSTLDLDIDRADYLLYDAEMFDAFEDELASRFFEEAYREVRVSNYTSPKNSPELRLRDGLETIERTEELKRYTEAMLDTIDTDQVNEQTTERLWQLKSVCEMKSEKIREKESTQSRSVEERANKLLQ